MKTSELHSLLTPIQMLRRVQLPLNIRSQSYKKIKAHIAEGPKEVNLLQPPTPNRMNEDRIPVLGQSDERSCKRIKSDDEKCWPGA